ncbi:DUF2933 domain-containing protein [Streptomyces sp. NPDC006385]|uniref:DUF2933 domain-containing protein n=1 Tax=Streptomyces sp. NPDC006385 TaxID=3156761 RepID=UPI0033A1306D
MSQTILLILVLLACPVAMVLMMRSMGRYASQNQPRKQAGTRTDQGAEAEVVRLRAEIDQLKAAQRDSDTQRKPAPPGDRPSGP